uniref:Uncharacterized protein n=1 Tax=Proboscia inermis TaxID=420281 RepID=A0A7S0GFK0_9STRA
MSSTINRITPIYSSFIFNITCTVTMNKFVLFLFTSLLLAQETLSFKPVEYIKSPQTVQLTSTRKSGLVGEQSTVRHFSLTDSSQKLISPVAALGTLTGFLGYTAAALAESSVTLEEAELPPPYVPVAFAIFLVASVGLLTFSLGDVIADEAGLGNLSGAKAKKEMERSRSSYFKK